MAGSKIKLRVLLIEDSEDDAELVCLELEQGGFMLERKRVETAQSLRQALELESWDVVVCDHNLPALDSSSALIMVRDVSEDLPFIIVSGSIPDEVAIESMRSVARDFIRKDNLSRLVPVIERELQDDFRQRERAPFRYFHGRCKPLQENHPLAGDTGRKQSARRIDASPVFSLRGEILCGPLWR
jgi:DNA-binding NtrC family response regulator